MFSPSSSLTPVSFFSGIFFFPTGIFHFCQHFFKTNIMKKKKKLRGILGRKKAMRARHGKQTCFFFWPNNCIYLLCARKFKIMHLRFNFDACPMHSPSGFVHLTHQNLRARALFCLNSLAKVNMQLLIYNSYYKCHQGALEIYAYIVQNFLIIV